jgi:hypothetical protein
MTHEKSEAPEAATPEASKPIPHSPDQKGNTSMSENPYPVDPVDSLTIGSIPDDELGPLFDATVPPITRFRQAVAEVDPAHLTRADVHALTRLMQAALDSGSDWAQAVAAEEMAAADEFARKADVIVEAMRRAGASTLGELFEGRGKGSDK